ncbi:HlyD family efflux transporter periplasmic adaptor subunit [Labilibaculum sp. A4]|uniref:HlyD family secretion protein n=1 Tax=Labilibaculum euxinus TaxID=2686357 RepID=UPI000F623E8F|nr:HlyD family efflux transporter periplasmic adaptor subunit [Labilibaculum euxinus]MDQ1772974.1 HlyD family efflux transporter periplasmic adaptor subunit [Labilibaculum euxinus]MWN77213.1 HlyD family efflux transporter periplasmic adaptor subunit [Labilibaculum euxinus]
MNKDTNIELRSDEVKEILQRMPNWIIRSGTTLFFVVIFALLIGSWFFRYPDIIHSKLVLTTLNPPAELVARSSGQIQNLYVEDNQEVKKGELLAIIENPAVNDDVFVLKTKMNEFHEHLTGVDGIKSNLLEGNFRLGEIQSYYNGFLKSYADYQRFFDLDYYDRKIESYKDKISKYNLYYERQYQQKVISESELAISKKQFLRDSSLFDRGVISQSDFQNARKKYLEQSYAFQGTRSSLASTQISISEVDQQIIDLELNKERERKELQNLLIQSFDNLKAQINIWEQKYVLITPIDGKVSFNRFYSSNQNVKTGERVFTVLPSDSTKIIARVELGVQGAGKVKIGQRVNIKLDNYPYLEYGMLEGTIRSISKVPEDQKYSLDVDFPKGLVTNYGIELDFAQQIEGQAEIITEDLRLLQRIFNPIRSLIKDRL